MARYAAFRTSWGYGEAASGPPGPPPVPGASLDGTFAAYDDPEDRYHRWVVEVPDAGAFHALVTALGTEVVFRRDVGGRYHGCYDLLDGGLDGILEAYDGWRE